MDEKISISVTVPGALAGSAKQFLQSLAFSIRKPDGELSPPPRINVERGSSPLGGYFVESLKIRPLGIGPDGGPLATVVEVVAVPIKDERGPVRHVATEIEGPVGKMFLTKAGFAELARRGLVRCRGCVSWDKHRTLFGRLPGGSCTHPKLCGADESDMDNDGLGVVDEDECLTGIVFGPDFGCVHFEPRDDGDLVVAGPVDAQTCEACRNAVGKRVKSSEAVGCLVDVQRECECVNGCRLVVVDPDELADEDEDEEEALDDGTTDEP